MGDGETQAISVRGDMPRGDAPSAAHTCSEDHQLLPRMREALLLHGIPSQDLQVVDEATLLRFLRARSMDVEAASKMLAEQLTWRASFVGALGYIPEAQVPNQLASHKMFLQGLTKTGMPLLIVLARRHFHASSDPHEFKRFVVHLLDKVIASAAPGVEKYMVLVDLMDTGIKNFDLKAMISGFQLLQNYYPERLGKLILANPPILFYSVWRAASPFLDSTTKKKITFMRSYDLQKGSLLEDVDACVIPKIYGGSAEEMILLQDVHLLNWPPSAKHSSASLVAK